MASAPPTPETVEGAGRPPPSAAELEAIARAHVRAPAAGLVVWGAIGVVASLAQVVEALLGRDYGADQVRDLRARLQDLGPRSGGLRGILNEILLWSLDTVTHASSMPALLGSAALWLALSCLVIAAGLRMRRLQSRGLAIAASFAVMVPCLTPCWCCCPSFVVGIPLGLWSLIALQHRESEQAFR